MIFFTYEFIKFFVRTVLLALTQCCPICFVKLQCLHLESFNAFFSAFWLWTGERNIQGMLAKLEPLHAMLERGPQTLKETSFHQAYGNDLNEAKRWCSRYKMSANIRDLNQAWDLYYHVFRRISRQLPQLTQLELQYVSPKLLMCRDLELAVPVSRINFTIFFLQLLRVFLKANFQRSWKKLWKQEVISCMI